MDAAKKVLTLFFQLLAVGFAFMTPYIAAFLLMVFIE